MKDFIAGFYNETLTWFYFLYVKFKAFSNTLFVLSLAALVFGFFSIRFLIPQQVPSMNNSFVGNELIITQKSAFKLYRGDVIILDDAVKGTMIKRLIGLPNERVEIINGVVYIDNVPLDEPYIIPDTNPDTLNMVPIKLLPNEVFVLGDNRPDSFDSRDPAFGSIRINAIKAKVLFVLYPFPKIVETPIY